MPPKKKLNGFMIFTFEWKEKYGKHLNLQNATTEAGKIWADMSQQERGPYNEKAKNDRFSARNANDKLTCSGVPLSHVEKQKQEQEQSLRNMKKHIEKTVRDSLSKNELETQKYYFVMVNYFAKTLHGGIYIPAEISVCEYSLKEGLCNKFHSYVNPGITIYGHTYEAKNHSDTTHQLPLPPNAMGEQNLGKLYNCILDFIRPNGNGEYPPLYTHRDSGPIVESVMNFLKSDSGAKDINLKIYSIQYLLFTLKEATCEVGEIEKPASIFITDAYFERDIFEYMVGIACNFHEERDKNNYCTLSCVVRWCYSFSEYLAPDIAIKCIPGRHLPANTKMDTTSLSKKKPSDTESFVSVASESSYLTNALSEHDTYYDDHMPNISGRGSMFKRNDFPDLVGGSRKKGKPTPTEELRKYLENDDEFEVNHWTDRSQKVPPQPDEAHFKIDLSGINKSMNEMDNDDMSSVSSFGRGRLIKASFGRGDNFSRISK